MQMHQLQPSGPRIPRETEFCRGCNAHLTLDDPMSMKEAKTNLLHYAPRREPPYNNKQFIYEGYYRDPPTKWERRTEFSRTDLTPNPSEHDMKVIKDSLLLLQQYFHGKEKLKLEDISRLDAVLELIPVDTYFPHIPMYPVGELQCEECTICAKFVFIYRRVCCGYSVCFDCLHRYYTSKMKKKQLRIKCCNPNCFEFAHSNEILAHLANNCLCHKTCPRCNRHTKLQEVPQLPVDLNYPRMICPTCGLFWCFRCGTEDHHGLTCEQNDKIWLRQSFEDQHSYSQKCPNCKVYVEKIFPSDRMHCTQCNIDFCYQCGNEYKKLMFFGDHSSKLSIFGCKMCFKADQPFQRMAIRGVIFGGKVIVVSVLVAVALCAGALAVASSVIGLHMHKGICLLRSWRKKPTPPEDHVLNND